MTPAEIEVYVRAAMNEAFAFGQQHWIRSTDDMFTGGTKAKTVSKRFQDYVDMAVHVLLSALESK